MTISCDYSLDVKHNVHTFMDVLDYRSQQQPDQILYTFIQGGDREDDQLSVLALSQQARTIAADLQSQGMAGKRALLLYPPGLEFITAFFGCLYAGVVAVPAYPPRQNQKLSRLQAIVEDAHAPLALTTTDLLTKIEHRAHQHPDLAKLQWLATDNLEPDASGAWQPPEISPDTLAFLQYTSGSTGTPKGVMVSQGNLMHNSAVIQQCFEHTSHSQGVIWLPSYHDMGLIGGVLQPLYAGFPVTLMSPADFLQKPMRWLQTISDCQGTTSGGPNFAYDLCVRKFKPKQAEDLDLSHWDVAFTGAEPIRSDTLDQFATTFAPYGFRREAFYPCYGMAETTLIISGGQKSAPPQVQHVQASALEVNQVHPASVLTKDRRTLVGCGRCLPDQTIVIVDPDLRVQCSPQQVGEIWVSSPSVTQGYWCREADTDLNYHAFLADTHAGPFLRTGDLGFMQDGELFITGRLKEVLIIRGLNHYPQDIEFSVENSHSGLQPSGGAAFAIDVKNEERVVIVQEVKRTYLRRLDANEVLGNIRQAVAAQHSLQLYAIALLKPGSLFKTSSGKIRRSACRAAFLEGTLKIVADWSENPLVTTKYLSLQTHVDDLWSSLSARS